MHSQSEIYDFGETTWSKAFVLRFSLSVNEVNSEMYSLLHTLSSSYSNPRYLGSYSFPECNFVSYRSIDSCIIYKQRNSSQIPFFFVP